MFNTIIILIIVSQYTFIHVTISTIISTHEEKVLFHKKRVLTNHCRHDKDKTYNGTLMDCRGLKLLSPPASSDLPSDTTTILLQDNLISRLDKDDFTSIPNLRHLDISHNNLQSVLPETFRANTGLVFLDLSHNYLLLDSTTFPRGLFGSLYNLVDLHLTNNRNLEIGCEAHYPSNLLDGLANLQALSIDTFTCSLNFTGIFLNATNLLSLTITGGFTEILTESFQELQSVNLKSLTMISEYLRSTEPGAFRYLKHLEEFTLWYGFQGMNKTLESLASLVNNSLTILNIQHVNQNIPLSSGCDSNNIMTTHVTRYLTQICVKHVILADNIILYVEPGSLTSGVWSKCLVSLDISYNSIIGSSLEIMRLVKLESLQSFKFVDRKYSILSKKPDFGSDESLRCRSKIQKCHSADQPKQKTYGIKSYIYHQSDRKMDKKYPFVLENKFPMTITRHLEIPVHVPFFESQFNDFIVKLKCWSAEKTAEGYLKYIIPLPKNFTYLNINGLSTNEGGIQSDFEVKGGENLMELHASDCGINKFTGKITGVPNIRVVDISKNDGSLFSSQFIGTLIHLYKLNMSSMNLDNQWLMNEGESLFRKFPNLMYLDLSYNDLYFLPREIFSTNTKLTGLSLAHNRFKALPFGINLSPNLCLLDLSTNSIFQLNDEDRQSLDKFADRMNTFTLRLNGNILSCGCSSISFLLWLKYTNVYFDDRNYDRNYSCVMETGEITTTNDMQDFQAFWRKCNGKQSFLVSLIISSLMLLVFCIVAMWMKFEMQLKAYFLTYFGLWKSNLKKPSDYSIGVYIGYTDHDVTLACDYLRCHIENKLGLTTYVHDRDLLVGSGKAECIVSAINSSWKVVLVLSHQYFQDPWSFLAIKSAVYSVQLSNPKRLVVIFTSHDLPIQPILTSVLDVVPEENIVHLTGTGCLDKKEQDAINRAVLP